MTKVLRVMGVLAVGCLWGSACSSSGAGGPGTGGKPGSGGSAPSGGSSGSGGAGGTGGASSSGGSSASGGAGGGMAGNGGSSGNEVVIPCPMVGGAGGGAGQTAAGGMSGIGGTSTNEGGRGGNGGRANNGGGKGGAGGRGPGGAAGGMSGAGGKGGAGTAGAGGVGGAPPTCEQFPSLATGPDTFTVSSTAFASCQAIPGEHTCDQKPFPQGTSPALKWTAGPTGTMSYAVVFKDLSVLARYESTNSNYNKGFHYVIWDIPANVTELPAGMKNGYASPDVAGALQWSNFNDYGYFGPCPNYDPTMPTSYDDSYAFIVYALPTATTTIPAPQMGMSPVRVLDGVFRQNALATAEYRGTSHAASSEIPAGTLPPKDAPPCPSDGSVMCGCVMRAQ